MNKFDEALDAHLGVMSAFKLTAAHQQYAEVALRTVAQDGKAPLLMFPHAVVARHLSTAPGDVRYSPSEILRASATQCRAFIRELQQAMTLWMSPETVDAFVVEMERLQTVPEDSDDLVVYPWDLIADNGFVNFGKTAWFPTKGGGRTSVHAFAWVTVNLFDLHDPGMDPRAQEALVRKMRAEYPTFASSFVAGLWLVDIDHPDTQAEVESMSTEDLVLDAPPGTTREDAYRMWRATRARWFVDTVTPLPLGRGASFGGLSGIGAFALFRTLLQREVQVSAVEASRPQRKAARRAGITQPHTDAGHAEVNVIYLPREAARGHSDIAAAAGSGDPLQRRIRVRSHYQRYWVGPKDSPQRHREWRRKAPYPKGPTDAGVDDRPRVYRA